MIGKLEKMDTFRQLIEDGDSDEYAQNEAVQILILESRYLDTNIEILADDEKEFEKDKATEKEIMQRLDALKAETFVEKLFQRPENRAEKKKIEESLDCLKRHQSRRKIQIRARKREIQLQQQLIGAYEKYINALGITKEEFIEEHARRVAIQEQERKMRHNPRKIDPYPELTAFYKQFGSGGYVEKLDTPYNRQKYPNAKFVSSKDQAAKQM